VGQQALSTVEKVFWLPDRHVSRAFPSAFVRQQPDYGGTVTFAAFVPGYSGGTTTDLHRLPDSNVVKCYYMAGADVNLFSDRR